MKTTIDDPVTPAHQPSAPPDPKALFSRLAAFSARHRRGVIVTWLLVAFAAAPLALTLTGALSGAGWEAQGSTAQQVRDELRRDFPQLGAEDPVVVYHQTDAHRDRPRRVATPRRATPARAAHPRRREPARTARVRRAHLP